MIINLRRAICSRLLIPFFLIIRKNKNNCNNLNKTFRNLRILVLRFRCVIFKEVKLFLYENNNKSFVVVAF